MRATAETSSHQSYAHSVLLPRPTGGILMPISKRERCGPTHTLSTRGLLGASSGLVTGNPSLFGCDEFARASELTAAASRRPRWQGVAPDMGWSPPPSDQRWSMTSPLTTVASLASVIAGPLSATAPAAATSRLSRSLCWDTAGQPPATASRPASAAWRWLDADVGVGADDVVDDGLVSAPHGTPPGTWLGSPVGSAQLLDADQVARGIAEGAVANPVGLLGRLLDDLGARWPAAARRCRRGPWWPGGSSRRCPWPSSRRSCGARRR